MIKNSFKNRRIIEIYGLKSAYYRKFWLQIDVLEKIPAKYRRIIENSGKNRRIIENSG
jgi:hypothetical protein